MGELDKVQAALQKKKAGADDAFTAFATTKMLERVFAKLDEPALTLEEFKSFGVGLAKELKKLVGQLKGMEKALAGEISQRPTDFAPVIAAVDKLEVRLSEMIAAVSNIKLPEHPKMPEPKDVDLTGLATVEDVRGLEKAMESFTFEMPTAEAKPTKWVGSITARNQAGFIKDFEIEAAQ
jgi:hypothetical protein